VRIEEVASGDVRLVEIPAPRDDALVESLL
jgi:hypothetical protein